MIVIVDKITKIVLGVLAQSSLAPITTQVKIRFDVYLEDPGTNVIVGYTCTINNNGTRSYAP